MVDKVQKICEEPVNEDLEEAANNAFNIVLNNHEIVNLMSCMEMFKYGANWQKTKDESITDDLGKYINELSKQFPEVSFAKLSRIAVRVAKWQKEQMIAKAIDGTARPDDNEIWCNLTSNNLKDGDKVKVIVIKED